MPTVCRLRRSGLCKKEGEGLFAWSLNLYGSALASPFGGIGKYNLGYSYPKRERKNIFRERNDALTEHYRTKRQRDAYKILCATEDIYEY